MHTTEGDEYIETTESNRNKPNKRRRQAAKRQMKLLETNTEEQPQFKEDIIDEEPAAVELSED